MAQMIKLSIRVPKEIKDRIVEYANENKLNESEAFRQLLNRGYEDKLRKETIPVEIDGEVYRI